MSLSASARYLNRGKYFLKFRSAYRRLIRIGLLLTDSISHAWRFPRLKLQQLAGHVRGFREVIIRLSLLRYKPASHSTVAKLINQAVAAMTAAAPPTPPNDARETSAFTEAFKERLHEIRRIIEEDRHRKRVLLLCQQSEPRSFEEYSSSGSFRKLEKFESSTYSEVLKAIDLADNNKPVVMKIMRALSRGVIKKLPPVTTKGCQSYNDILNELVITQALSKLHDGVTVNGKPSAIYKAPFFCFIHEIKVVSGNLERTLSKSQAESAKASISNHLSHSVNNLMKGHDDGKPIMASKNQAQPPPISGQTTATTAHQTIQNESGSSSSSRHVSNNNNNNNKVDIKDEELKDLSEEDRMLMEALPYEYVVTVMRHDGQPLWWMMTHKKLNAEQLTSVLVQVIVGLAIAEKVYSYEHRDLHVSNILIKKTSKSNIPFTLDGHKYNIVSYGIKATIIDATFSRLIQNGKVYYRDLTSTLRAYGSKRTPTKMSLQNSSYRQMVQLTKNKWQDFTPKTNLIWLTYLCETLIKNDVMKSNPKLLVEIKKIRDYTLKVSTTLDLLSFFPFDKEKKNTNTKTTQPVAKASSGNRSSMSRVSNASDKASTFSSHKNDK